MNVKPSKVVAELKTYWEQIEKTSLDKSKSSEEKERDFGNILIQIAVVLDKHDVN